MEILKVGSKSNPSKVAGAIANIFRENKSATIQTVGAASLNQAINGEKKTAIKLIIESK